MRETISDLRQSKVGEDVLGEAVAAAHAEGLDWDKIGRALGITRQGARKRWDTSSASLER